MLRTPRQRRRADQIGEHHRQLPAFGVGLRRCSRSGRRHGGGRHRRAERDNGVKQLAPVADRCNADLPEILRRQLRQHLLIDLIVAEGRHILLEPQALQPRRYVHAVILGSEERSPYDYDIPLPLELPAAPLKWDFRIYPGEFGRKPVASPWSSDQAEISTLSRLTPKHDDA